ncbi:DUF3883 domain-containing protein [Paenarthrobacter ilicis]|uniref:DUF3883 domain-containing protein n=1 Tax=Paenarthrobacter ilicis TaxID=43665 RepID=UPI003870EC48
MTAGQTGMPWTGPEIDAVVEAYFDMMMLDMQGQQFVKARVYRNLSELFPVRTMNSIERKMSNVSAVLVGLGYPHLRGLSPLVNYQRSLVESVISQLNKRESLDKVIEFELTNAARLGPVDIVRESSAPTMVITDILHGRKAARPFKRNYLELEAGNRKLGLEGELAVVRREQRLLHGIGRKKLADRVEHVAVTQGDGLGYDVLSFDVNGREKLIEVKTTTYAIDVPFFVTRGEVRMSEAVPDSYHLYRLFGFGNSKGTGLYQLEGDLNKTCRLDAISFRATPA